MIAFQPAIELPSNMKPSVSLSSSITPEAMVRCCHLPLGSVKRRSTQSISSSLIRERIVPALLAMCRSRSKVFRLRPNRKREAGGGQARRCNSSLGPQIPQAAAQSQEGSEYFTGGGRCAPLNGMYGPVG